MQHLACIMDGNRRWAIKYNLAPWYGHKEGIEAIYRAVNVCVKYKIAYLSLFAFAIQNFKRSECELHFLFEMLKTYAVDIGERTHVHNVKIKFYGDMSLVPNEIKDIFKKLEEESCMRSGLQLNIFFAYSGQEEIVAACRLLARDAVNGIIDPESISLHDFSKRLWSGDLPHPDLIVRTGNMQRLSNFLLYQSAYTELYFLDCLWPELTEESLENAVMYFKSCKRNFGI